MEKGQDKVERKMLRIELIRHGRTQGNVERRYVGRTDEPLCEEGIRILKQKAEQLHDRRAAEEQEETGLLFISPMLRCAETAKLLFPEMEAVEIAGFRETDFGSFEYKTYEELKEEADYQAWIESGGQPGFPEGESRETVKKRVLEGWKQAMEICAQRNAKRAVFVVHGGTIMELLEAFGEPQRSYYDWMVGNAEGYCGRWSPKDQRIRIERNWP